MNLVRCAIGHYYDGDKFSKCPHCQPNAQSQPAVEVVIEPTTAMGGMTQDRGETMFLQYDEPEVSKAEPVISAPEPVVGAVQPTASLKDAVKLTETIRAVDDDDDQKTVRLSPQSITGTDPVVGWLIGVNGAMYGDAFPLKSGRNFIGRGTSMDVILYGDNSISRDKHAVIIYEPRARIFIAQPGESKELFYINDEVVLGNVTLKKYDIVNLGSSELMFVPLCDEKFCWEDCPNN